MTIRPLCLPIMNRSFCLPVMNCPSCLGRPSCLPIMSRPPCLPIMSRPFCLPVKPSQLMKKHMHPIGLRRTALRHIIDPTFTDEMKNFLLQESDLYPTNKLFLSKCNIQEFGSQFGRPSKVKMMHHGTSDKVWRLNIVLPLHTLKDPDTVVPIPFIIDTGAPYDLYLGTGAIQALHEMNLMEVVEGQRLEVGRLLGNLRHKNKELVKPLIHKIPIVHEVTGGIEGDVRINVIGLPAIIHFGLCICK